jgi:pyrroline-5-carboxylate reductase
MFNIGFLGAGKMAEGILAAIDDKKSVIMAEKLKLARMNSTRSIRSR